VTLLSRKLGARPGTEVVVLFTTSQAELERRFNVLNDAAQDAASVPAVDERHRRKVRRVSAADFPPRDDWQAVRFVYRLRDR